MSRLAKCLALLIAAIDAPALSAQPAPQSPVVPAAAKDPGLSGLVSPYPSTSITPAELPVPFDATSARPAHDATTIAESPLADDSVWYTRPLFWIGTIPWDTGIELGINGATGSSEAVSIRTGGYIKRESEFAKIDISAYYNKTSANGMETQNNAQFDIRNELAQSNDPVRSR